MAKKKEECNPIPDKCIECENDTLLKYAALEQEYSRLKRYYELTVECLDIKEMLNKALREENQELIRKLELYKNV